MFQLKRYARPISPQIQDFRKQFITYDGLKPVWRDDVSIEDVEAWIDGTVDEIKADNTWEQDEIIDDIKARAIRAIEDL